MAEECQEKERSTYRYFVFMRAMYWVLMGWWEVPMDYFGRFMSRMDEIFNEYEMKRNARMAEREK